MTRHRHRFEKYCDCRDHDGEEERNCCCVNETFERSVCWENPIELCSCGERR